MKSVVFNPEIVAPSFKDIAKPVAGRNDVVVRVKAAALNHRDLHITNPNNKDPFVYGSDAAGIIESVGVEVNNWKPGDEVIINPQISCMACDPCLKGIHTLCEDGKVLGGLAWNGTFADYVKVPARNVEMKPDHLTFNESASLPLALGTAWRALITLAKLQPGEKVLIQGIGGGVAQFCLQIAVSMGAEVYVTSGSIDKISKAIELGARCGVSYLDESVEEKAKTLTNGKGFDVILSSDGRALPLALKLAVEGGRIVQYAYIAEPLTSFDVDLLMFKQLKLYGTAMFNYSEFKEAVAFVNSMKIKPVVSHLLSIEKFNEGFRNMKNSNQFGKIVFYL